MSKITENTNTSDNEDDFSKSIARLAELASNDIADAKPKESNEVKVDDQLLKEFMKPKRKVKPKGWKEKWGGKTVKLKVNPYVASGILILLMSTGIIALPKINAYFEQKRLAKEAEEQRLASISQATDKKLKTYNVFDAAKDVGGKELKATNLTDLIQSVEKGNKIAEENEKLEALNATENILATNNQDVQISFLGNEYLETQSTNLPWFDSAYREPSWDLYQLSENLVNEFSLSKYCSDKNPDLLSEDRIYSDIVDKYLIWSKNTCS